MIFLQILKSIEKFVSFKKNFFEIFNFFKLKSKFDLLSIQKGYINFFSKLKQHLKKIYKASLADILFLRL